MKIFKLDLGQFEIDAFTLIETNWLNFRSALKKNLVTVSLAVEKITCRS